MPNQYLARYAYPKQFIQEPPHPRLGLSVVIPCYQEPNLLASLDALRDAMPPLAAVEVLVVINAPDGAPEAVGQRNMQTLLAAENWKRSKDRPDWKVHLIFVPNLPRKHAGVGLARKIGMDEAYRRFVALEKEDTGVIICFDADSGCAGNYLTAIEEHFLAYRDSPGCSIHYEHPLQGSEPEALYEGITGYEVHLRYYVDALRWAGYPHAYQTIGSSMAVRAHAYAKVQGMNRRKAGEDFYFLHKIIPLGRFTELTSTKVIPSPRISDRVPFGTGKAMGDWIGEGKTEYLTYHPAIFEVLRPFMLDLLNPTVAVWGPRLKLLHPMLADWLEQENFLDAWQQAREQSTSEATYHQRMLRWLDGLRVLKYVHHARDWGLGMVPVAEAANWLLSTWGVHKRGLSEAQQLQLLRHHDRQGWYHPAYPQPKERSRD